MIVQSQNSGGQKEVYLARDIFRQLVTTRTCSASIVIYIPLLFDLCAHLLTTILIVSCNFRNYMSLVQILSNKLVGNPLLITTGVISSSYFICGNLGAAYFGIVPAIRDAHGADLTVATKVELWKWYFDRAKVTTD
jgi:hypothetical protein